jgi:hypothetical protein
MITRDHKVTLGVNISRKRKLNFIFDEEEKSFNFLHQILYYILYQYIVY